MTADDSKTGPERPATALATFGGGCFWCLEAVFARVKGVTRAVSGYAGGHVNNPSYAQVCTGQTGHAEVVQVEFDPRAVTYERLLEIFFAAHDPTTLNRQGPDVGTQYRSIILAHDDAQRRTAEQFIARLNAEARFGVPVVTQVEPLQAFFAAEPYHQEYYAKNSRDRYCRVMIAPKLAKLGL